MDVRFFSSKLPHLAGKVNFNVRKYSRMEGICKVAIPFHRFPRLFSLYFDHPDVSFLIFLLSLLPFHDEAELHLFLPDLSLDVL